MKLSATNVESIFKDCLAENAEGESVTIIEGIMGKYALEKPNLNQHSESIAAMLDDLPVEFQKDGGGGMSFLNACNDKSGEQWTGLHQRMEELFVLGMGINRAKFLMPREMWPALPGSMPYIVVG